MPKDLEHGLGFRGLECVYLPSYDHKLIHPAKTCRMTEGVGPGIIQEVYMNLHAWSPARTNGRLEILVPLGHPLYFHN